MPTEGQDLFLLLVGALTQDGFPAGKLVEHVGGATFAAERLVGGSQGHPVGTEAVVFLGQEDAVEAELTDGLRPLDRVLVLFIALVEVCIPVARRITSVKASTMSC